jgi:hypothetical protein
MSTTSLPAARPDSAQVRSQLVNALEIDLIGPRQAALLSNRWRQQLRSVIDAHQLDPATALAALMALAGEKHRKGFYAVLTGFRAYSPQELSTLWLHGDRYRPQQWLEQWHRSLPAATSTTGTAA